MFIPYITIYDDNENEIEVTNTPIDNFGRTLVRVEVPDSVFTFKVLECYLPSYELKTNIGLKNSEFNWLMLFIRNNAHLILENAMTGGK